MGNIKNTLRKVIVAMLTGCIKILPPRAQAAIKEGINPEGKLDYGKDIKMHVTCEAQIMRLAACQKEPETVRWIEESIQPGDVFYDIGANVGGYSFVADACTDGQSQVYAFEPSSSTFSELSRNIMLNKASGRIVPFSVALSSETRLNELHYSSTAPGAASHQLGGKNGKHADKQSVLSYTMDDFADKFKLAMPNLIKIDVDGSEYQVLRGAQKAFENPDLRSVLIEIDYDQPDAEKIEPYMETHGFKLAAKHQRSGAAANCIFNRRLTR